MKHYTTEEDVAIILQELTDKQLAAKFNRSRGSITARRSWLKKFVTEELHLPW